MKVIQVGDVLERNRAFTDHKSLGFVYLPNFMYSEGVSLAWQRRARNE